MPELLPIDKLDAYGVGIAPRSPQDPPWNNVFGVGNTYFVRSLPPSAWNVEEGEPWVFLEGQLFVPHVGSQVVVNSEFDTDPVVVTEVVVNVSAITQRVHVYVVVGAPQ